MSGGQIYHVLLFPQNDRFGWVGPSNFLDSGGGDTTPFEMLRGKRVMPRHFASKIGPAM